MSPVITSRPTEAIIDLQALEANFRSIKAFIADDLSFLAVVKANAYGHGAVECAQRLSLCGVDWFAVALIEEAVELREAGIEEPILCLGGVWPGQENLILEYDLTPSIFQIDDAIRLNEAAHSVDKSLNVHVKIDSGMGRVGIRSESVDVFASQVKTLSNIKIDGIMSHFASADNPSEDDFTRQQIRTFDYSVAQFREHGIDPSFIDIANSPGAICRPDSSGNMVRIGGILYGLGDDVIPAEAAQPALQPVMSVRSKVAVLKTIEAGETVGYGRQFKAERPTKIATVPIGYHDGYRRGLSNKGTALIRGHSVPVVGTVSMDWITLDVSGIENVVVGDEVTLLGVDAREQVAAAYLATILGTISYEITCGISIRVPRVYLR